MWYTDKEYNELMDFIERHPKNQRVQSLRIKLEELQSEAHEDEDQAEDKPKSNLKSSPTVQRPRNVMSWSHLSDLKPTSVQGPRWNRFFSPLTSVRLPRVEMPPRPRFKLNNVTRETWGRLDKEPAPLPSYLVPDEFGPYNYPSIESPDKTLSTLLNVTSMEHMTLDRITARGHYNRITESSGRLLLENISHINLRYNPKILKPLGYLRYNILGRAKDLIIRRHIGVFHPPRPKRPDRDYIALSDLSRVNADVSTDIEKSQVPLPHMRIRRKSWKGQPTYRTYEIDVTRTRGYALRSLLRLYPEMTAYPIKRIAESMVRSLSQKLRYNWPEMTFIKTQELELYDVLKPAYAEFVEKSIDRYLSTSSRIDAWDTYIPKESIQAFIEKNYSPTVRAFYDVVWLVKEFVAQEWYKYNETANAIRQERRGKRKTAEEVSRFEDADRRIYDYKVEASKA